MGSSLPAGVDSAWLKRRYLFAVQQYLRAPGGGPFPEELYTGALCNAADMVALDLGIIVNPTPIAWPDERSRYDMDLTSPPYWQVRVRARPIISVSEVLLRWGRNTQTFIFPIEWVHVRDWKAGQIDIIYDQTQPVPQNLQWFWFPTYAYGMTTRLPAFYQITYEAGFASAEDIPPLLLDAIGLWAAIQVLVEAGQALSRGIASQSIGQDGLSQSRSFARGGSQPFADDINTYRERYERNMVTLRGTYGMTCSMIVA